MNKKKNCSSNSQTLNPCLKSTYPKAGGMCNSDICCFGDGDCQCLLGWNCKWDVVLHVHTCESVLKRNFHSDFPDYLRLRSAPNTPQPLTITRWIADDICHGYDGFDHIRSHDDDADTWDIDPTLLVRLTGKRMAKSVLALYTILVDSFGYGDTGGIF